MITTAQYDSAIEKIKTLESLPGLGYFEQHELTILKQQVQDYEDAHDLEVIAQQEAHERDFEDRFLELMAR